MFGRPGGGPQASSVGQVSPPEEWHRTSSARPCGVEMLRSFLGPRSSSTEGLKRVCTLRQGGGQNNNTVA
eukprot:10369412-Alexandrium_andersonii.AAC.1